MEHLSKAFAAVSRTVLSAQELLRDQELRNKGIQTVISGAQIRLQGIQNGLVQRAGRLGERLQDKQRQLQGLLVTLEERLYSSQRLWQLQASRRLRVDVQFGRQLIADAPQEVRARLWYVLLENPHLAAPLKCQHPGAVPNRVSDYGDTEDDDRNDADLSMQGRGSAAGVGAGPSGSGAVVPSSSSSSLAAAAAAVLGFSRPTASDSPSRSRDANGAGGPEGLAVGTSSNLETPTPARTWTGREAGTAAAEAGVIADMDGWELVGGATGSLETGLVLSVPGSAAASAAHPEAVRIIMERLEVLGPSIHLDESGSDPVLVAHQAVLEAMLQVPWENGVGLPPEVVPDSRYAMLNEMTAGQEEVDDSIMRDIHRTFPEHPYFGLETGQMSLFRVLKAYSLHDLEVAYCQGMAFMAGVLLMYVPEEVAFRLFCRLMDPDGPNLRRLYVPGLEPLKAELATFELLLSWRLPELGAHLTEFGLPPVLYVSQWLMTLFATPFPPPFCARVIDVLLQDGHDRLLLRCSYAIMEALEGELLARHDFEALITYLKMEPVSWGITRQRAIMEHALTSPITDAEIEVARDTVASRQFLAAALGGGAAVHEASTTASPSHLSIQTSIKREVDAALAAAAAALTVEEGGSGDASKGCGAAGAAAAHAPSTDRGHGRGGDMISWEEDDAAAAPGSAPGPGAGPSARGHGHAHTLGGGRSAPGSGAGGGGSTLHAQQLGINGSGGSPSLLDELGDLATTGGDVAAAGSMSYGLQSDLLCGMGPQQPSVLDGEYGEMLMDVGLLLPEVGTVLGGGGGRAGRFGTLEQGAEAGGLGGGQAPGQQQQGQDLLLD